MGGGKGEERVERLMTSAVFLLERIAPVMNKWAEENGVGELRSFGCQGPQIILTLAEAEYVLKEIAGLRYGFEFVEFEEVTAPNEVWRSWLRTEAEK